MPDDFVSSVAGDSFGLAIEELNIAPRIQPDDEHTRELHRLDVAMLGARQSVAHIDLFLAGDVLNALDERVLVRLEHDGELEIQDSIQCLAGGRGLRASIAVSDAQQRRPNQRHRGQHVALW